MVLNPPDSLDDNDVPPPVIESAALAPESVDPATQPSDKAAKWFVVAFLVVVPVLGFALLGAVCYSLWRAFFA